MVDFYIVRHGQTLLNCLNKAQGWVDSPLTEVGKETAISLGNKLEGIDFDAAYTSDMIRAVQTAELILQASKNTSIPIQKDIRLREWCLGSMETENNAIFIKNISDWLGGTISFAELNGRIPDIANAIYNHDMTGMVEPFPIIETRLINMFTDIAKECNQEKNYKILVVTHAFVIKTLFYLFAPDQLSKINKIENSTVSLLKFENSKFSMEQDWL